MQVSFLCFRKALDRLIALGTNRTGIRGCNLTRNTQPLQQQLYCLVALKCLFGNVHAFRGKRDNVMRTNGHIPIPLKLLEKHADCRSGYPQIPGKICRMNQLFL